jgi:hypothetical protein
MSAASQEVSRKISLDVRRLPALAKREMERAQLPALYVAARKALAACDKIDECKDIADKHSAIAHYAKQIKDKSLLYHAERIYLRALTRIGELLVDLPSKERAAVAKNYGVAAGDASHAIRMASLPKKALDKFIDKEVPASKNEISWAGGRLRNPRPPSRQFSSFERTVWTATPGGSIYCSLAYLLHDWSESGSTQTDVLDGKEDMNLPAIPERLKDAKEIARSVDPRDVKAIRYALVRVLEWLDDFERALPKA